MNSKWAVNALRWPLKLSSVAGEVTVADEGLAGRAAAKFWPETVTENFDRCSSSRRSALWSASGEAAATAEISGDGRERPVGLRRFGSKRLGLVAVELADLADLSELAASGAASTQKGAGCG